MFYTTVKRSGGERDNNIKITNKDIKDYDTYLNNFCYDRVGARTLVKKNYL